MKCAKCGAEISKGCVYCPVCGQEARIVDDIEILEDDLLRAMLEGEEEAKKQEEARQGSGNRPEDVSEKKDKGSAPGRGKKKSKNRVTVIIVIIVIIAAAAAVFGALKYKNNHSVDYLMEKAEDAYSINDYQTTLSYLEKVLELESENADALLLKGTVYYDMKDTEEAEEVLLYLISLDPSNTGAYSLLLQIYSEEGDYDSIVSLKETSSDSAVLDLFEGYILEAPTADTAEGTYNDYLEITVTASENAEYIYYTLDGTDPTAESTVYDGVIEIDTEGETVLKLICADENGNLSAVTELVYEINLEAPDMPVATPEGGTFTVITSITVDVPEGCTVYYTWDNTDPDSSSNKYTGVIEMIEGNNVLSLIAIDQNGMKSQVQRYNFVYIPE